MSLIEVLTQPLSLAIIIIGGAGLAAIVYVMRKDGGGLNAGGGNSKKIVDVLRPVDYSGFTLPIIKEFEKGLQGPKVDNVYWRLYKGGAGWNFPKGQRKFYALEGDAYTGVIVNDIPRKCSLPEAMLILWGPEAYKNMPQTLKDPLEKHKWGVVIEPQPVPKKDKDLVVTMEDHNKENIKVGMEELRKNMQKKGKLDLQTFLFGGAACSLILLVIIMVTGHLKV